MGSISTSFNNDPSGQLLEISRLVGSSEIIDTSSREYADNAQPWSTGKDQNPRLVLRPATIESLSKVVAFLSKTDLDYKVRSQGFGSASAKDVLISLAAFDDFEFNREEEYVMLGAGGNWRGYYERMEAIAPDWTIVCARTPCIGIGGSTLCSGFSWLSSEYGCVSDPANMLDAHVVAADGKAFWASTDPDLLWSLRGTEGGFAIATHFKFRARRFPENGNLWGGPILVPRTKVKELADGIMAMVEKDKRNEMSLKTSMFLYVMRKELLAFIGASMDMLVVHAFDARGEKAGREEFRWALKIEGAVDQTRGDMTLAQVAMLQAHIGDLRGTSEVFWSSICLTGEDAMTTDVIVKSFDWWASMLDEPNSIAENGYVILELFSCRDNLTGRHTSAWPRPVGYKHMLLLGAGCGPNSSKEVVDKAKQYVINGPKAILGKPTSEVNTVPNAIEEFHDVDRIYGEHMRKLREVKTRVDPTNKLKGWIKPDQA